MDAYFGGSVFHILKLAHDLRDILKGRVLLAAHCNFNSYRSSFRDTRVLSSLIETI